MAEISAIPQQPQLGRLAQFLRYLETQNAPEFLPRQLDVMGLVRQLTLPQAATVENLSYGNLPFTMPPSGTGAMIPQVKTGRKAEVADLISMISGVPGAGAVADVGTKLSNTAADQLVRMITRNPQATAPGVLEAAGEMAPLSRIIGPEMMDRLRKMSMQPVDEVINQAIQNTPGAKLTETGLELPVTRYQRPVQGGRETSRSGVFYGIGDKAELFKDVKGDMPGGSQKIEGVTKVQNPLFAAGDEYFGSWKDAFMKLNPEKAETVVYEVDNLFAKNPKRWEGLIDEFYQKYAPNEKFDAKRIIKSNPYQQKLMLIESALAHELKQNGYDSMVGVYGSGVKNFRGIEVSPENPPTIFEVFDVREATYPKKSGATTIRPEFLEELQQGLLD